MKMWKQKTMALMMSAVMLCGCVVGVSAAEEEYYNRIKADSVVVNEGYTIKLLNSAGAEVASLDCREATHPTISPSLTIGMAQLTKWLPPSAVTAAFASP